MNDDAFQKLELCVFIKDTTVGYTRVEDNKGRSQEMKYFQIRL